MAKTLIAVVLSTALVAAQTRITPPKNKYTLYVKESNR